jgi:hypothetical protein
MDNNVKFLEGGTPNHLQAGMQQWVWWRKSFLFVSDRDKGLIWPFKVYFQERRKWAVQKILKQTFARSSVKNALNKWCQFQKLSHSDTQITWLI